MKFQSETSYVGPIALVLDVLGSEELLRKREADAGAEGMVNYSGTSRDHIFQVQVPNSELPSAVRSFLPNGLTAVLTGTAKELTEAGQVQGASLVYDIAVQGAPASGSLTFILADGGATTPAKILGEISVNIPFVGGRLEKAAVKEVEGLLAHDTELVNEEVARVRAEQCVDGEEPGDENDPSGEAPGSDATEY